MKTSMHKYSYFDFIVSHVNIKKGKKVHTKKRFLGKLFNTTFAYLLEPIVVQHYKKDSWNGS